jgi:hypothetical protein
MHRLLSGLSQREQLTGQPLGLRGEMAGHASIEPALDLGGQMKNCDSHGGIL